MNIKRLNRSPLIDVVCEVRFCSDIPAEIIPGLLLKSFEFDATKKIERLPSLQIPESIRLNDVNLKYLPLFKVQLDETIVQFGTSSISISSRIPYIGWDKYSVLINNYILKALNAGVVAKIERIGLRSINFFAEDVLVSTNYDVKSSLNFERTHYNYTDFLKTGDISIRVNIADQTNYQSPEGIKTGSVLDIDSYIEIGIEKTSDAITSAIDKLHVTSKNVFFGLIKEAALIKMEPVNE